MAATPSPCDRATIILSTGWLKVTEPATTTFVKLVKKKLSERGMRACIIPTSNVGIDKKSKVFRMLPFIIISRRSSTDCFKNNIILPLFL